MGLFRKAAWLASGGIVRPTSKEEKRHAELLAAIQGKDAKTVRRTGGRYDASNLLGGTPDGTPLFSTGSKGSRTVPVPAENAPVIRVRHVVGTEGLEQVFEVLRAPHAEETRTEEPANWARRYRVNLEKLASGDVLEVAEVVWDLWHGDKERDLSAGEERMLAKARQILVSEIALAEKTSDAEAEALLDELLAN